MNYQIPLLAAKSSPHQSLAASLNQGMNLLSLCPMGCDRREP